MKRPCLPLPACSASSNHDNITNIAQPRMFAPIKYLLSQHQNHVGVTTCHAAGTERLDMHHHDAFSHVTFIEFLWGQRWECKSFSRAYKRIKRGECNNSKWAEFKRWRMNVHDCAKNIFSTSCKFTHSSAHVATCTIDSELHTSSFIHPWCNSVRAKLSSYWIAPRVYEGRGMQLC